MSNGVPWHARLQGDPWFATLPAALQDRLLAGARLRRVIPGKLLFASGDAPCGLYVLLEGGVRMGPAGLQRHAPNPEQVRLPCWFGEVSLFDGLPRTLEACSTAQSIVLQVPQALLDALLESHPHYRHVFARLLSQKLGLPWPDEAQRQALESRARVAWRILLLGEGYGALSNARRLIDLTAIESCATLGLAGDELLAVLQDLHQRRIIRLDPQRLEVLDTDRLRTLASTRPARPVSAPARGDIAPASCRSSA